MSSDGSVSVLMGQLADSVVQQQLWERYYSRLVELARRNLRGVPRRVADEEDVASHALDSFFRAVQKGRFPRLEDRDDLWKVLVTLTLRKAHNLKKYEHQLIRDCDRNCHQSDMDSVFFQVIQSPEPSHELAAEVAESCQALLQQLPDDRSRLRTIAVRKMEGYKNEEISAELGVALSTVELRLARIRKIWSEAPVA